MLEQVSLVATVVTAVVAVVIAWQANSLAKRNLSLESDKLYLEWGQHSVRAISKIITLRRLRADEVTVAEFSARRRDLRTEIFTCIAQGRLLLRIDAETAGEIVALRNIANMLNSDIFFPPHEDETKDNRSTEEIEVNLQGFIIALQDRLPDDWVH